MNASQDDITVESGRRVAATNTEPQVEIEDTHINPENLLSAKYEVRRSQSKQDL